MDTLYAYVTKIISAKMWVNEKTGVLCMNAVVEYECWGRNDETTLLIPFDKKLEIGYKFEC